MPKKVRLAGFSSSHVWMWELDYRESWAPKNWCFWTVVLERTLESPLNCKEIKPINPEGNQSWIFIGRTGVEAETLILWPPDAKNWLIGKDPDARKDWRQEKGTTEDEIVGWHYQLDGREFKQALEAGDRQGSLACCSPWGRKELDTTQQLNWTDRDYMLKKTIFFLHIDMKVRNCSIFEHRSQEAVMPCYLPILIKFCNSTWFLVAIISVVL